MKPLTSSPARSRTDTAKLIGDMAKTGHELNGARGEDGGDAEKTSGSGEESEVESDGGRSEGGSSFWPFFAAGYGQETADELENQLPMSEEASEEGPFFATGFDDIRQESDVESEDWSFFANGFDDIRQETEEEIETLDPALPSEEESDDREQKSR